MGGTIVSCMVCNQPIDSEVLGNCPPSSQFFSLRSTFSFERKATALTSVEQRQDIIEHDNEQYIPKYKRERDDSVNVNNREKNKEFSNCHDDTNYRNTIGCGSLSIVDSTLSANRIRSQIFLSAAGTREKHEQLQ